MADQLVSVTIDGQQTQVPAGLTIIKAAETLNISIPSLCYHKELPSTGGCGICLVEIQGQRGFTRACTTPVAPNMVVRTRSRELTNMRRGVLELILTNHPDDCFYCIRNGACELQTLARQLGIERSSLGKVIESQPPDMSSPSIVRDPDKCVLCGRCVAVCGEEIQTVFAIGKAYLGFDTIIGPPSGKFEESLCVNCGQCVAFCPTGALHEKEEAQNVWAALEDPEKIVVVQEAPAVRVSLAEAFQLPVGTNMVGKMYRALKLLGFKYVFDTNFAADVTIMEEGTEFIDRLQHGGVLPLITSCSPGWIKFVETFYHDMLPHVSSCKSPQQMFGVLAKTYFAQKYQLDPAKIVTVSIMPCTAKKFEARRPEMQASGYQDVDHVLTTRELIAMIREAGIDFAALDDSSPDDLMGQYTGAGTIFGATGGVMEAALRTVYEKVTGTPLPGVDVKEARGIQGVKEFSVDVAGTTLNFAVANGLGNARKVLDRLAEAKEKNEPIPYHFIEVMACPGGCVGGGGQPYGATQRSILKRRAERATGLYAEDREMKIRKSHENPEVVKLYEEFLEHPLSHKSHELLHTTYTPREEFTF